MDALAATRSWLPGLRSPIDPQNLHAPEQVAPEFNQKDSILFVIDARKAMLQPGPDGGPSFFAQASAVPSQAPETAHLPAVPPQSHPACTQL